MQILHTTHHALFEGEMPSQWIRTMSNELDADIFTDEDFGPDQLIELAVAIIAEQGSNIALIGIALDADLEEEHLEKVPTTVYYYTIVDEGRNSLDPLYTMPTRLEEEVVAIPEWFPCQNPPGSTP